MKIFLLLWFLSSGAYACDLQISEKADHFEAIIENPCENGFLDIVQTGDFVWKEKPVEYFQDIEELSSEYFGDIIKAAGPRKIYVSLIFNEDSVTLKAALR